MDTPKPIKRSQALISLSREHHDGLLLVYKIRQGIKLTIEPERIASYCTWFWKHHLEQHFDNEERVLGPYLDNLGALKDQLFREHSQIRQAMQELNNAPKYPNLENFGQLLNDHIRFEERVLFNEIERSVTPDQLEEIASKLSEEDKAIPIWEDEFWIHKK